MRPSGASLRWDGVVRLERSSLDALAERFGGRVDGPGSPVIERFVPVEGAAAGDLAPLLSTRAIEAAREAVRRGAALLVSAVIAKEKGLGGTAVWRSDAPQLAMARVLEALACVPDIAPSLGDGVVLGEGVVLAPRVVIGDRVRIGPGSVIGHPGFGWAFDGDTALAIPQLGGVVIDDDVRIGPLCTVDAGTLGPTRIRRGAKLDAHVHVAHNCDIGEGTIVAAQSGFAGSVRIGRGVLVGGQVGVADHVTIGDGARIAAKSGVIGDVPAQAVVAGYPAVARVRWLRALAWLYRHAGR